jgi:hypothetical protein
MEIAPGTSADKLVQDRDVDADSTFFENATFNIFSQLSLPNFVIFCKIVAIFHQQFTKVDEIGCKFVCLQTDDFPDVSRPPAMCSGVRANNFKTCFGATDRGAANVPGGCLAGTNIYRKNIKFRYISSNYMAI